MINTQKEREDIHNSIKELNELSSSLAARSNHATKLYRRLNDTMLSLDEARQEIATYADDDINHLDMVNSTKRSVEEKLELILEKEIQYIKNCNTYTKCNILVIAVAFFLSGFYVATILNLVFFM